MNLRLRNHVKSKIILNFLCFFVVFKCLKFPKFSNQISKEKKRINLYSIITNSNTHKNQIAKSYNWHYLSKMYLSKK